MAVKKKPITLRVPVPMLDELTDMADFFGLSVQDLILFVLGTTIKSGEAIGKGLEQLPHGDLGDAIDLITKGIERARDRI